MSKLLLPVSEVVVLVFGESRHDLQQFFLDFGVDRVGTHMVVLARLNLIGHRFQSLRHEPSIRVRVTCIYGPNYLKSIYYICLFSWLDADPSSSPCWRCRMFGGTCCPSRSCEIDMPMFSCSYSQLQYYPTLNRHTTNIYQLYYRAELHSYLMATRPSSPRYSIRTNLRPPPNTWPGQGLHSALAILCGVCLLVMICFLLRGMNFNYLTASQHRQEQQSNRIPEILQMPVHDAGSAGVAVRLEHLASACPKVKKQQLWKPTQNIRIFELIRNSNSQQAWLDKYFRRALPLSAIKHPKFSSPLSQSPLSILSLDFWNPFRSSGSGAKLYENVDRIFNTENIVAWKPSGMYLTIAWDRPISPALLVLRLAASYQQGRLLFIYGISVVDSVLVNQNTLESTFIMQSEVGSGYNRVECNEPACLFSYSMLMLLLDPMEILSIELYSHKDSFHYVNYDG